MVRESGTVDAIQLNVEVRILSMGFIPRLSEFKPYDRRGLWIGDRGLRIAD